MGSLSKVKDFFVFGREADVKTYSTNYFMLVKNTE